MMRRLMCGITAAVAITISWSSTSFAMPPIKVLIAEELVFPGMVIHGRVFLGTALDPLQGVIGVGFRVNHDPVRIGMTALSNGPLFGSTGNVQFSQIIPSAGQGAFSIARTTGVGINGSGIVCNFDLLIGVNANNGIYRVELSDIEAITSSGQSIALQAEADSFVVVYGVGGVGPGADATALRVTRPFPNPVRNQTQLSLDVREPGRVRVAVYDSAGRLVRQLQDEEMGAGPHSIAWDARCGDGSQAAPGIYFIRVAHESDVHTSPVVVIR